MDDGFTVIIALLFAVLLGVVIGVSFRDETWVRHCETIGMHIASDRIYDCNMRGK
jgi:hypothetical protein